MTVVTMMTVAGVNGGSWEIDFVQNWFQRLCLFLVHLLFGGQFEAGNNLLQRFRHLRQRLRRSCDFFYLGAHFFGGRRHLFYRGRVFFRDTGDILDRLRDFAGISGHLFGGGGILFDYGTDGIWVVLFIEGKKPFLCKLEYLRDKEDRRYIDQAAESSRMSACSLVEST